ncbi:uncharacterized protein J3R85_020744 [Psidium guajava]|nr:uncharacterized protein J3R85_020744 [Psidium guajava]
MLHNPSVKVQGDYDQIPEIATICTKVTFRTTWRSYRKAHMRTPFCHLKSPIQKLKAVKGNGRIMSKIYLPLIRNGQKEVKPKFEIIFK